MRSPVSYTHLDVYKRQFEDFTVLGMWLVNQSQGGDNDRHFVINGVQRLRFSNVESLYCRQMGITGQWCSEVIVTGCRVRFCARDMINFSGSRKCIVTNNHLLHGYDDAIAIHQEESDGNPPVEGHVVTGNILEEDVYKRQTQMGTGSALDSLAGAVGAGQVTNK